MHAERDEIKEEASKLLLEVYGKYKDKGMLAIYFWGSITRDDFDPTISDVDSIAIIDKTMDLEARKEIRAWLESHFSRDIKFGLQFYGLEELNGEKAYTLLGEIQPPGYLLLRFGDWVHVAGKEFSRKDFSAPDMSPEQAVQHQLAQVARNIDIFEGRAPEDPRRSGRSSVYEDIIKGSLGALCWYCVMNGKQNALNYNELVPNLDDSLKIVANEILELRAKHHLSDEDIELALPRVKDMIRQLKV